WHAQDPVSPIEVARNNASYAFQGNRNPFIDTPQWVNTNWGVSDNIAPTAPTGLTAGTATSSSVPLNWTAATDNIAVAGYDIYVNGVYHSTVSGTSATVSGLAPTTTSTF